jgi:subtilisin family serine protease
MIVHGQPLLTRTVLVLTFGLLLSAVGGCSNRKPDRDFQQISSSFAMKGPNSVPYVMFNVTTPGQVKAEVSWAEKDARLTVALFGRRHPERPDPNAPYAVITDVSPLTLVYDVTAEDIARGVNWRLVISGDDDSDTADGTVSLKIPFREDTVQAFLREKVAMRAGDLWPSTPLQTSFESKLAATTGPGLHGIITLKRAVDCVEARRLERLGLIRQSSLPKRHSFGFVRKGTDLNHPLIQSVLDKLTPLDPEDRVDPSIWVGDYARFVVTPPDSQPVNYLLNDDGTLELSVLFAKDVPVSRIKTILNAEALNTSPISDSLWRCTLQPAQLSVLAAYDEVEWIEAGPMPLLPTNDRTRQNINVDPVQNATVNAGAGTIAYAGLTGNGVTAGVCDSGVDANHPDLNVVADLAGQDCHGTHVAGIIAGSGVQSDQNDINGNPNPGTPFQYRGMAPEAGIIDWFDMSNAGTLLTAIQTHSLDVCNHSHTLGHDGNYNAKNQILDQEIRGGTVSNGTTLPRRPQTTTSANNGAGAQYGNVEDYFACLNQTKNSIVLGNWNVGANRLAASSSMGPAHDGRIKPDLVAPGSGIRSTGTADDEVQVVEFQLNNNVAPTAGTFTLTFGGNTTAAIAFDATAAAVENRLLALPNLNAGDINVWGGPLPGSGVAVEFVGPGLTFTNVAQMTTVDTGINNGAATRVRTPHGGHDNRNGYQVKGGTSMAAPATAGVIALLLERWQTTYNAPIGATLDANPPLPSTLKAVLIQTAVDIDLADVRNMTSVDVDADNTQGNNTPGSVTDGRGFADATAGPDFATGWGRVDAQAADNLLSDWRVNVTGNRIPKRVIQGAVNQGGIVEYDFVVDQVGQQLRVTLVWDDVEAALQNPATNPTLVNDLDLELVDPNGTIHYPWQLGQEIQDLNGNVLADNAQPAGTDIQVVIPIQPAANPANDEYIPENAFNANGVWVARRGKDHLNNVEQVFVQNVAANQVGHWTLRVIGFDIDAGSQDYSVVGFPYPDLAELEVSCTNKVGLAGLNMPIVFNWTVTNTGDVATGGPGTTFDYRVLLSRDFYADSNDVVLTDSNQAALGPLGIGESHARVSSVQITQANANALLGAGTTIQDLQEEDVFLLIQADSGDVVLEHNETNVAFVQLARPVDVVMVLDKSGSMSGVVPVSNGSQTKMEVLQDSANLFLDLLRQGANDELAEVSFSAPNDIDTIYGPTGLTPYNAGNVVPAKNAVNNLQPATSTDIRGGLQRGLDVMTAGANQGHRRVLIFFSDGKRTAGLDPTKTAFLQQFDNEDIHVYSVGFGTKGGTAYTGIDVDLLETLTNVNPSEQGFFHVTESPVALDKFFVNAVAGAVDSQVVLDPEGDLSPGQSHTVGLSLTEQDYAATFILTWDNPASAMKLAVRTPSGLVLHPGNASSFGGRIAVTTAPAYTLMTVQLPITTVANVDQSGRWEMVITNPGQATVHYSASAISESTIRANMTPPSAIAGGGFKVGDPIPFRVSLTELGGVPIYGADVTVTPNVPLASLGTVLSSAGITQSELDAVPKEMYGEELSTTERLYLALQKRLGVRELLPRKDLPPFYLTESEKEGVYTGQFAPTRVEGFYGFTIHIEGVTPKCQLFQRELSYSVVVAPDPDSKETVVKPEWNGRDDPRSSLTVTVKPVASGGHLLGPGFSSQIQITGNGMLKPTSEVVDQSDGSYTQTFQVLERGPVQLKARVAGIDLPDITLDTALPVPLAVKPEKCINDAACTIVVSLDDYPDVSSIERIILTDGKRVIPLDKFHVDEKKRFVKAEVPRGVEPGLYSVVLEGGRGRGPGSKGATFEAIERK